MLPSELAEAVIKLGICYQLQVEQKGLVDFLGLAALPPKEEDFTEMGYNKDNEEKTPKEPEPAGKIVTDPAELIKYDGWHLSMKIPKEFPKTFRGPHYSGIIHKRKFIVRGDDYPWTTEAIKHSFTLEYVKDIKLHNNILLVQTSFGQTGIVIN